MAVSLFLFFCFPAQPIFPDLLLISSRVRLSLRRIIFNINIMASTSELKDALVESMTYSGAMARIRARVRAEIAHALDVGDASHDVHSDTTTKVPFETTFIHELVREYLRFHNLRDTSGVFVPEAGMADAPHQTCD